MTEITFEPAPLREGPEPCAICGREISELKLVPGRPFWTHGDDETGEIDFAHMLPRIPMCPEHLRTGLQVEVMYCPRCRDWSSRPRCAGCGQERPMPGILIP
jgi:hypothetical protein